MVLTGSKCRLSGFSIPIMLLARKSGFDHNKVLILVRFMRSNMEHVLASRSVSITELKRSPSAVLAKAGSEVVAVLNHNRPAAYLLPPHVYEAMLERLSSELRQSIRDGIDSGIAIPADRVFAELNARYADPKPAARSGGKRKT